MWKDTAAGFLSLAMFQCFAPLFFIGMAIVYGGNLWWQFAKNLILLRFKDLRAMFRSARMKYPTDYSVLITGAGSGIGRALVEEYVRKFAVTIERDVEKGINTNYKFKIFCVGRNKQKLEETQKICERILIEIKNQSKQTKDMHFFDKISVQIFPDTDVTREDNMREAFERCCNLTEQKSLDLVIANAGTFPIYEKEEFQANETENQKILDSFLKWKDIQKTVADTNFTGVLTTIFLTIETYLRSKAENENLQFKQRPPQIVIVSSLAALTSQAEGIYGATKHSIHDFGFFLRHDLNHLGIKFNIVVPGLVKTPLSEKLFSESLGEKRKNTVMRFEMDANKMAESMIHQLEQNRPIIYFSLIQFLGLKFFEAMPLQFERFYYKPVIQFVKRAMETHLVWVQETQQKRADAEKQKEIQNP